MIAIKNIDTFKEMHLNIGNFPNQISVSFVRN